MKKSKFTEQQIAFALQQAEGGANVAEVCRRHPIGSGRPNGESASDLCSSFLHHLANFG